MIYYITFFNNTLKVTESIQKSNFRLGYVENPHKYAKILLGQETMKPTPITKDFIYTIKPSTLIAWAFSGHEPPVTTLNSDLYRYLLQLKYSCQRFIQKVTESVFLFYDIGIHLKERMVFKDLSSLSSGSVEANFKATAGFNLICFCILIYVLF